VSQAENTQTSHTKPFAGFEWMLALRYLRPRRQKGFVSVIAVVSFLGIMLGVAALIVVMSVMNGFRKELLSKFLGVNAHVFVREYGVPLSDYVDVTGRIAQIPGVKYAIPFIEGEVLAFRGAVARGAIVRGIRPSDIKKLDVVSNNIRSGSLDAFGSDEGIAIGKGLSEILGVSVGDSISLLNPTGNATPMGLTPSRKDYKISAVFEVGAYQIDSVLMFLPLTETQAFLDKDDTASVIEVFVNDPDNVGAFLSKIEAAAIRPVTLTDWRYRDRTIANALIVERNVMFLLLMLIVLVASLNIIAGLFMLVKDKSRDIAILRTMGATRGAIMRVFLIAGAFMGGVGTIAGFMLGLLISYNLQHIQDLISWMSGTQIWDPTVRFLTTIPTDMNPRENIVILFSALALSLLATVYPAWRAAKLDPVEALRYE
jgi:lipoprotein-releasing system permease protein